jgi:hypothetical protein
VLSQLKVVSYVELVVLSDTPRIRYLRAGYTSADKSGPVSGAIQQPAHSNVSVPPKGKRLCILRDVQSSGPASSQTDIWWTHVAQLCGILFAVSLFCLRTCMPERGQQSVCAHTYVSDSQAMHVRVLMQVYPSSVIICNHSGERYWYAWDDATGACMTMTEHAEYM